MRRPPQSAHMNAAHLQRPAEARGYRSSKPQNGTIGDVILDDLKSPLSQTQTNGILGEDEDDLFTGGLAGQEMHGGFGIDYNFKS